MTTIEENSGNTLEGKRILVADDDLYLRELLEHLLTSDGAQVTCASSGAEAIRFLEEQEVDLLLSDIFMPGGDGLEAIAWAREHAPEMAVAVMSGGTQLHNAYDSMDLALELGAQLTIHKPFRVSTVLSQLRQLTADK